MKNRNDNGRYEHSPHLKTMAEATRNEIQEVAHDVIADELRPVVREAMTEDVLRSIHQLVALTPEAIVAIGEDLQSGDPVIRNRASTLVLKYTLGHPALIRPSDADPSQQLTVNLNLPRPGAPAVEVEPTDAVELRTCDKCGKERPTHEFVADSLRCQECWDAQREEVAARFG